MGFNLAFKGLIKKCERYLVILRHCQVYMKVPLNLQPEDGFMRAEICSCYVILTNQILCNAVVLDFKFIYYINY